MNFYIKTYGCQMNVRDSESVAALLLARGYGVAAREEDADVYIVNTCSVRGKAEDKALGKLRLMIKDRRDRGVDRIIGVMGCMVQRMGAGVFKKLPGLDFAVGTGSFSRVCHAVDAVRAGRGPVLETGHADGEMQALSCHTPVDISAYVNILFGCNRRCAFCIVPEVRGNERSRQASDILEEVRRVVSGGAREITLLGQSVMSYGRTNDVWPADYVSPRGYTAPLSRLLEAVCVVDGVERVRFTSGHPSGCTDELVRAMLELPQVCEHLHLPLQSGSDRILGMMRRGYTVDEYRDAVARLRAAMPGMALTTDIIVGFPSETQEDFEMTLRVMKEIGFDNAFIFKYSPRPGTPAEKMEDDVPVEEKKRRNQVLLEQQDITGLEINGRLTGQTVEVLVEGESLRNETRWAGRSGTNTIVIFKPVQGVKKGDLVTVLVTRVMAQTLYGDVVADGMV